ncbi:MAG: hypothetical protein JO345_15620 [Streptosporangiaceae bacterium]|nr:hypothetical protein [Streptosporangiaceae bacterium]
MVDPVTLGIAIAAFIGTVVVGLVVLTLVKLFEWFKARRKISQSNRHAIGVILAQRLNDKNYVEIPGVFSGNRSSTQLVQAIYDQERDEILDARAVSSGTTSDFDLIQQTDRGDGMIVLT